MSRDGILMIVSGSVEAANAPGLSWLLKEALNLPISIVLTDSARRFVTCDALLLLGKADEVLTGYTIERGYPTHIRLAQESLAVLVYPASAGFIGKAANGLALDLASTCLLALIDKPVMFVPSMNESMWKNPLVARNVQMLQTVGITICSTETGISPSVETIRLRFLQLLNEKGTIR